MVGKMALGRRRVLAASAGAVAGMSAPWVARAAEPIKIGAALELSGRFASFGASGKRGLEMAAAKFGPTVAGRPYEFLFRDVQSEAQATISVFTALGESDRVNYIIGPIGSPVVGAAIPAWQQSKPIWLVPGNSSTLLEQQVGQEPHFFHTFPYAYHYHASCAAALKHYLGAGKTMAILYTDDDYGETHVPFARQYYSEAGINIVATEKVRAKSIDMGPALGRIGRAKPDILLGLVQTTDQITLTKQVQSHRLEIPYLIGTASTQLKEWQDAVGPAQEGWLGITTYLPGVNWPANKTYPDLFPTTEQWRAEFVDRYKRQPDFLDVGCYATAGLLLIALQLAGEDDQARVAQALRTMDMPTVFGRGHFHPSAGGTLQQAFTDMLVFQRQGGDNVFLYPLETATGTLIPVKPS
jgi:branched-chain amino acid transport system substrate-binding protein